MSALEERILKGDARGIGEEITLSARGLHYRELNLRLRRSVLSGAREIHLVDVFGQRYIGTNLGSLPDRSCRITIHGTPGTDLGAFMDGPTIEVYGNAQDGVGNTMNSGTIIIHGHAGDILGMSMRGGEIFVRGNVGARCAVHMKEYGGRSPLIVIGGTARDFLGEYMAGGTVILLGLNFTDPGGASFRCPARFVGTGMHGGRIFLRGSLEPAQLGPGVKAVKFDPGDPGSDPQDAELVRSAVEKFAAHFNLDPGKILNFGFTKLYPRSRRPYGAMYGGRE